LTGSEVEVIEIVGDGLVERRQLSIDQQMVMTGIRTIESGGCNPHLLQTETDCHFRLEWSRHHRDVRNKLARLPAKASDRQLAVPAQMRRRM